MVETKPEKTRPPEERAAERTTPAVNVDAIRVINEWAAQSSEYDDAFWRELEQELRGNRLTLGRCS